MFKMMEESDFEEQEEYTAIYRKSRKKHRRRKHQETTENGRKSETSHLSPFIVGATPNPNKYENTTKTRKNDINEIVRETLGEIGNSYFPTQNVLREQGNRVFLGECAYEDDDISTLQTTRIWKFRKSGKRVCN